MVKQPYYRCLRCGSPTKKHGSQGRPPKYCSICSKGVQQETDKLWQKIKRNNIANYKNSVIRRLIYNARNSDIPFEYFEPDYIKTPFGVYKVLGSRETTSSYLNKRERELLKGTKDKNWRKKEKL